jgi:hypothetical protein
VDERGEIIWTRRLRPRWRGAYAVLLAIVAAGGLWAGCTREEEPAYGPGEEEAPMNWALLVGLAGSGATVWATSSWAPKATLTGDGVLRYRALSRQRSIDLKTVDHVTVAASPVVMATHGTGAGRPGRWVMEVRPAGVDAPHQQSMSIYRAPEGVVGVASPPLTGAELDEFLLALGRFTEVRQDEPS